MLLWLDLETTGTDEHVDPILEVGAVITPEEIPFTELGFFQGACVPSNPDWRSIMGDYVLNMHTKNGLLADLATETRTISALEAELIEWMSAYGSKGKFLLAGSGVGHFDRRFIVKQMPRLEKWLRYPNFDIGDVRRLVQFSGRKDLVRSGLTQELAGMDNKAHRGLDDIRDHIAEAAAYGEMFANLP
jgi:oligoribonuclease